MSLGRYGNRRYHRRISDKDWARHQKERELQEAVVDLHDLLLKLGPAFEEDAYRAFREEERLSGALAIEARGMDGG